MKKTKYTEEWIAFALKQAETGAPVQKVNRTMGISERTFYNRKKKYGGQGLSELRRLKQLEEENARPFISPEYDLHHMLQGLVHGSMAGN